MELRAAPREAHASGRVGHAREAPRTIPKPSGFCATSAIRNAPPPNAKRRGARTPWRKSPPCWRTKSAIPWGAWSCSPDFWPRPPQEMPEANQWVTHLQAGLRSLSATVNNVLQFHSQPCGELLPRKPRPPAARNGRVSGAAGAAARPVHPHRKRLPNRHGGGRRAPPAAGLLQPLPERLSRHDRRGNPDHPRATGRGCRGSSGAPAERNLVQVDFEDQGSGIDPTLVERIFEPGFTTKAGSPGLGLSVCKKVVEQHGGTIRVAGTAQAGSTFSIRLPLETPGRIAARRPWRPAGPWGPARPWRPSRRWRKDRHEPRSGGRRRSLHARRARRQFPARRVAGGHGRRSGRSAGQVPQRAVRPGGDRHAHGRWRRAGR